MPNTPQQNGVVERCFVTFRWQSNAMLLKAPLLAADHKLLWAEAATMATHLCNWLATRSSPQSPLQLFQHGKAPHLPKLVEFGKLGFVTCRGSKPTRPVVLTTASCLDTLRITPEILIASLILILAVLF